MLWLALTLLAAPVSAVVKSRPFNVTLTDQDSMLQYEPPAATFVNGSMVSTPPEEGWNVSYSELAPWSQPMFGKGYSTHTTRFPGANVSIMTFATDIFFWGWKSEDTDLRLTVDGVDMTSFDHGLRNRPQIPGGPENITLLRSLRGLELKEHTIVLLLRWGQVRLTNVTITTAINTEAVDASMTDMTEAFTVLDNSTKDGSFTTKYGEWSVVWDMCNIPDYVNKECPNRMSRVTTWDEDGQLAWTTPVNASYMELITLNDHNGAVYNVKVTPVQQSVVSSVGNESIWNFTSTIMSPFMAANNTIYQIPLSPGQRYYVTVTRRGPKEDVNPTYMSLHSVRYRLNTCNSCSAEQKNSDAPPAPKPIPPPDNGSGADIAVGVVGGLVGLGVIIGAYFWWRRRRARQEQNKNRKVEKEIDEVDHVVTPFTPVTQSTSFLNPRQEASSGSKLFRNASGVSPTASDPPSLLSPNGETPTPMAFHHISDANGQSPTASGSRGGPSSDPAQNKSPYRPESSTPLNPGSGSAPVPASPVESPTSSTPTIDRSPLVLEQEDAGRIVEWLPPRYNERWRTEHDADGASSTTHH